MASACSKFCLEMAIMAFCSGGGGGQQRGSSELQRGNLQVWKEEEMPAASSTLTRLPAAPPVQALTALASATTKYQFSSLGAGKRGA